MAQKKGAKAAPIEEDLPPPPRREAAPKEKSTDKADKDKKEGRDKAAAEPMSVDKEPPAKVRVQQLTFVPFVLLKRTPKPGISRCFIFLLLS